jgi:hypothetical protein
VRLLNYVESRLFTEKQQEPLALGVVADRLFKLEYVVSRELLDPPKELEAVLLLLHDNYGSSGCWGS